MRHVLDVVHSWLIAHPITWGLVLLFVSWLLSLYSKEIKEFLHTWPIRTLHAGDRNRSRNRLETLEWLHGNTYNLVLYLAASSTAAIKAGIAWNFIILVVTFALYRQPQVLAISWWGTLLGICIGKAMQINTVLTELLNYEQSTARLKSAIAYHEEKLALKTPPAKSPPT